MTKFGKDLSDLAAWPEVLKQLESQRYRGVVLALSGGLDSTALLHAFCALTKDQKKISTAVFHTNYGLRGADSAADQSFCAALAEQYQLPFFLRTVAAQERAGRQGESLQAWARRLRRAEFARLAADGWLIALGHHQDDLAENVLLRLARGCSPAHLLGMQPWRAPLWRPLLAQPKTALATYLHEGGLAWREDASNASLAYARNRLRHRVLPELEALFPGAAGRLVACAEEARDLVAIADQALAAASPVDFDPSLLAKGAQRHLAAAQLQGKVPRLSRRRLDQHSASPQVPLAGPVAGKAKRQTQHARSLAVAPPGLLIEPNSYAFFRCPEGLWRIDQEAPGAAGHGRKQPEGDAQELALAQPVKPVQVFLRTLSRADDGQGRGTPAAHHRKNLFQAWAIPPERRHEFFSLEKDAVTLGVHDGLCLRPLAKNGNAQTGCSQAGLNLRYLKKADQLPPA